MNLLKILKWQWNLAFFPFTKKKKLDIDWVFIYLFIFIYNIEVTMWIGIMKIELVVVSLPIVALSYNLMLPNNLSSI